MKDGPTRTKTTKSSPCIGPIHQTSTGLAVHSSATPSVQWSNVPAVNRSHRPSTGPLPSCPQAPPSGIHWSHAPAVNRSTIHPLAPCTSRPPRSHHPCIHYSPMHQPSIGSTARPLVLCISSPPAAPLFHRPYRLFTGPIHPPSISRPWTVYADVKVTEIW